MKNKPVVVLLGKTPPPYMGPAIATEIILKSKLNEAFELVHLNTKTNEDLTELGQWSFKKIKQNYSIYFSLMKLLSKHKPDLVLIPISQTTTGFVKDSFFILISALYKRKILLQLRGSDFKRWISSAPGRVRWYVKFVLSLTNGMIVLGNNLKYLFEDYYTKDRIFVVPNGGDYQLPPREVNEPSTVRILFLANLIKSKGIDNVLNALAILEAKTPAQSYTVDVIGKWLDHDFRDQCFKIVEDHHLPVVFHPVEKSKQKLNFLVNADIFVFTPREPEGHPWVIVEAMAAGLPVISTDQGAIIESVIDGKNGFIVGSDHPAEIAVRLQELINSKDLRNQMGTTSRKYYEQKFTEQKMVENLTKTFLTVMNN
jgi:glycosyltransferase involved in cell wall biosynthesis